MPKIVYPICCGIDVHKSFVMACIASTNESGVTTYSKPKRFSTFTNELRRLLAWLAANNCREFVWNLRENTGFQSTIFLSRHVTSYLLTQNI